MNEDNISTSGQLRRDKYESKKWMEQQKSANIVERYTTGAGGISGTDASEDNTEKENNLNQKQDTVQDDINQKDDLRKRQQDEKRMQGQKESAEKKSPAGGKSLVSSLFSRAKAGSSKTKSIYGSMKILRIMMIIVPVINLLLPPIIYIIIIMFFYYKLEPLINIISGTIGYLISVLEKLI